MTLIRHYDAQNAPRGALHQILPVVRYPVLIWRNRYMVQNFFRRDLMSRVHGSILGIWWILLQPLFLFAIYFLVFGMLFGSGPDPKYAIYLFSGVIVFVSLIEATSQCCQIVVDNGNLVKKVAFPSEVLPVSVSLTSIVIYLVGAVVCVVAGLSFGVLQPGLVMLAWPLVLLVQFVLTLGIGLFLANLYVFVRDVGQLWRLFAQCWQFLSPVFWQPQMLREKLAPHAPWLANALETANPAYSLIMAHRLALGGDDPMLGDFWTQLGICSAWATFFLLLGYSTFMASKHKYADLV
jgi:ABC-type polysaccharide/polyol phosphate export permease